MSSLSLTSAPTAAPPQPHRVYSMGSPINSMQMYTAQRGGERERERERGRERESGREGEREGGREIKGKIMRGGEMEVERQIPKGERGRKGERWKKRGGPVFCSLRSSSHS